jgi:hypothetical protein
MTSTNKDLRAPATTTPPAAVAVSHDDAGRAGDDGARDEVERRPRPAWAGGPATASTTSTVVSEERVQLLEAEVRRLQKQVEAQQQVARELEGQPIPFPEGRTPASDQAQLMSALQTALEAHGLDGDVAAIDCSEFPCIAHGAIQGIDDEALNAVFADAKAALGGAPYASLNRFVDDKDAANSKTSFSLSLYPEGLPQDQQDNLNKRLRARKNAYVDAAAHD